MRFIIDFNLYDQVVDDDVLYHTVLYRVVVLNAEGVHLAEPAGSEAIVKKELTREKL